MKCCGCPATAVAEVSKLVLKAMSVPCQKGKEWDKFRDDQTDVYKKVTQKEIINLSDADKENLQKRIEESGFTVEQLNKTSFAAGLLFEWVQIVSADIKKWSLLNEFKL